MSLFALSFTMQPRLTKAGSVPIVDVPDVPEDSLAQRALIEAQRQEALRSKLKSEQKEKEEALARARKDIRMKDHIQTISGKLVAPMAVKTDETAETTKYVVRLISYHSVVLLLM